LDISVVAMASAQNYQGTTKVPSKSEIGKKILRRKENKDTGKSRERPVQVSSNGRGKFRTTEDFP